jgi:hypothetical protein
MTFALIFAFIRQHFMAILIGLAVLFLVGYIGSLKISNHLLRKEVGELTLQITTLHNKEQQLAAANQSITDKYREMDGKYADLQKKNLTNLRERIKNEKELATIKLTLNAVSLFNASKGDSVGQDATTAIAANASRAATLEKTLADLLLVTAENDANHIICIDTVKKWQNFWKDYSATVIAINNGTVKK